ncbi:MAG: LON peptidase substrate-binding domain-containing protein, partial [Oscillospiraceae bacterium]|nr:LON peptidase substrate-binding domain-containing protein [Oscillospiraceae bacterium]
MQEKKKLVEKLPTVPMRGTVAFPHMIMHFDVARAMSVQAVELALKHDRKIFLTAQKDVFDESPIQEDLYQVGIVAEIRQPLKQD